MSDDAHPALRRLAGGVGAAQPRARKDFKLREGETGLSVFEVATDEEKGLLLAAWACRKTSDEAVDYIEVERSLVERRGSIVRDGEGDTPVPAANALHCTLPWSQSELDALVVDLFAAGVSVTRCARPALRSLIASLDPGRMPNDGLREFVEGQRARVPRG